MSLLTKATITLLYIHIFFLKKNLYDGMTSCSISEIPCIFIYLINTTHVLTGFLLTPEEKHPKLFVTSWENIFKDKVCI